MKIWTKKKSDRFEYIFPNFEYEKKLYTDSEINGEIDFNSRGYKKMYETNIDESILVNDIKYLSYPKISSKINGLQTNYKLLIRYPELGHLTNEGGINYNHDIFYYLYEKKLVEFKPHHFNGSEFFNAKI